MIHIHDKLVNDYWPLLSLQTAKLHLEGGNTPLRFWELQKVCLWNFFADIGKRKAARNAKIDTLCIV